MNDLTVKPKPVKIPVKRIQEAFENSSPYNYQNKAVIKDYVYSNQKRFIA